MLVVEFGEISTMSTLLFALRSLTKEYESSNETVSSTVALGQKIPGFEAGRKSAYLLFPKRGEKEKERRRKREGEEHARKRTYRQDSGRR